MGGQNDFRILAGVEVPLGHVRVVQAPPEVRVEVKEVIKEVPRPWIDTDGDGVDDEHDLCPNTPKGLKVDATGCVIAGQQIVLNGVVFEFNKTRLVVNAQTILDTLAPAFLGQPSLKVEIAGHTDSIGSVEANQKLSQGRAEAVREYLISKGAKPEQLTAKGYGKSEPLITPEVTSEDRERNRRVEFRVLEK
jgi:OOP family OmpA-OmpF porin